MEKVEKKQAESLLINQSHQSDTKLKPEFRQGICSEKYNQKLVDQYKEVIEKILAEVRGKNSHAC